MSDQPMNLKSWLVTRQPKAAPGARLTIRFATVFLAVVALCGTWVEAATYDLYPDDDWISIIGYDPSQPGPLSLL